VRKAIVDLRLGQVGRRERVEGSQRSGRCGGRGVRAAPGWGQDVIIFGTSRIALPGLHTIKPGLDGVEALQYWLQPYGKGGGKPRRHYLVASNLLQQLTRHDHGNICAIFAIISNAIQSQQQS
jgi:hypothetical protein